jgi:hypothetical protein
MLTLARWLRTAKSLLARAVEAAMARAASTATAVALGDQRSVTAPSSPRAQDATRPPARNVEPTTPREASPTRTRYPVYVAPVPLMNSASVSASCFASAFFNSVVVMRMPGGALKRKRSPGLTTQPR